MTSVNVINSFLNFVNVVIEKFYMNVVKHLYVQNHANLSYHVDTNAEKSVLNAMAFMMRRNATKNVIMYFHADILVHYNAMIHPIIISFALSSSL